MVKFHAASCLNSFQSFLCWILLWKYCWFYTHYFVIRVSILLMLDIALEECCQPEHCLHQIQFQSFLCWILLWKKEFNAIMLAR